MAKPVVDSTPLNSTSRLDTKSILSGNITALVAMISTVS